MNLKHLAVAAALFAVIGNSAFAADTPKDEKPLDDASFVQKAGMIGMTEVEMGKACQASGRNEAVKRFGDRMVKDHNAANEELKTISAALPVAFPERLDDKQQKEVDQLKNLTGADFDKAYMDEVVKGHEQAVELYKKAGKEVNNTRLKEFATKTLPTLEDHLKQAKEIRDQLK